ncbi:MAG: cation:proton antiporter [Deltaproteobacteria bacterium]
MIFGDIIIMLVVACAGLLGGRLLGLPPVVSYLIVGVLAGPGGFGLLERSEAIGQVAEIGVALLLFGVGVEFSLVRLRRSFGRFMLTGALQVLLSAAAAALAFKAFGIAWPQALIVACLVSLSSTAVVFKLYVDRGELAAPHGQAAAGVLLFQDLAVVPMMMLLPVLALPSGGSAEAVIGALLRAGIAVGGLLLLARFLLPRILVLAARAAIPELFPPLAILIALGTAFGAAHLGLSLPLGAFLAGLALSGSPYSQQVFAELLPLRDAFLAIFFTSIGMLLRPAMLVAEPWLPLLMVAAVLLKGVICGVVVGGTWRSLRLGLLSGFVLAQMGEFSFVLGSQAVALGLITDSMEQAFIATAILTIAATPLLVAVSERLADRDHGGASTTAAPGQGGSEAGVLLVGYGVTGQAIARVLYRETPSISFLAIDMKADRVAAGQKEKIPVRFGDASRRAVLEAAGAASCRAVVVAVSDPRAARRIVVLIRSMNPKVRILVRARRVEEIDELENLGADEVIPGQLEASIELFARLLVHLGVPRHVARLEEQAIRLSRYGAMRGVASSSEFLPEIEKLIRGGIIETAEVMAQSRACGATLADLDLRRATGAAVLTIVRDEEPISNPGPDEMLKAGDLVVLYGPHQAIAAALELLEPKKD